MIQDSLFPEFNLDSETEASPPIAQAVVEDLSEPSIEQLLLFTPLTIHRTALDRAIATGDFAESANLRDLLSAEYGPGSVPADLASLDRLAAVWIDPLDLPVIFTAWHVTIAAIGDPEIRRRVTRGLFTRLVQRVEPSTIAESDSACMPDLVNLLYESGRTRVANELIRDALLRGVDFGPNAVNEPSALRILAEDYPPRWLACFGALRGVWPTPPLDEIEPGAIAPILAQLIPDSDAGKAIAFWYCMRVAASKRRIPEALLHAARRRMKELNREFHQLHMTRAS